MVTMCWELGANEGVIIGVCVHVCMHAHFDMLAHTAHFDASVVTTGWLVLMNSLIYLYLLMDLGFSIDKTGLLC